MARPTLRFENLLRTEVRVPPGWNIIIGRERGVFYLRAEHLSKKHYFMEQITDEAFLKLCRRVWEHAEAEKR
jgi:hypothetical protein